MVRFLGAMRCEGTPGRWNARIWLSLGDQPCSTTTLRFENGVEQFDQRDVRALTYYLTVLEDIDRASGADDLYLVVSQSGNTYLDDARERTCECPDHTYRGELLGQQGCKHLRRVMFATGERAIAAWVECDAVDPALGEHVDGEVRIAAPDGGQFAARGPANGPATATSDDSRAIDSDAAWPFTVPTRTC